MSKKKTFKNPDYVFTAGSPGSRDWHVGDDTYPSRDYDMEVTFTKKVKPLAVGDVVRYDNHNESRTATVIAIDEDQVWLKFNDGSHATWDVDELVR